MTKIGPSVNCHCHIRVNMIDWPCFMQHSRVNKLVSFPRWKLWWEKCKKLFHTGQGDWSGRKLDSPFRKWWGHKVGWESNCISCSFTTMAQLERVSTREQMISRKRSTTWSRQERRWDGGCCAVLNPGRLVVGNSISEVNSLGERVRVKVLTFNALWIIWRKDWSRNP